MNVKSNDVNPLSGETSEEVSHLPRRRRKLFAGIRSCRNEGQNVQVLARKVEGCRPDRKCVSKMNLPLSAATVNLDIKKALAEACPEFFAFLPDKKYWNATYKLWRDFSRSFKVTCTFILHDRSLLPHPSPFTLYSLLLYPIADYLSSIFFF